MMAAPQLLRAKTLHARKGAIENRFRYRIDMVLIDPEADAGRGFFGRNRANLFAVHDRDYGLDEEALAPPKWVRGVFEAEGLADFALRLVTQPRVMGTLFNPVSFWIAIKDDAPVGFLAEVNNTFKERHFYLCHHPDFAPISEADRFHARKVFYVSPFQEIAGEYCFKLRLTDTHFAVSIDFGNGDEGVLATLYGERAPLSNRAILGAALRRPIGGWRVTRLIFYQALKLKSKGAVYRVRPKPPQNQVSS